MENCLKTIHVSLTCENQPIKYLARDPRVDICISLQLYHERNYTTMPSPDLIGRFPDISIWELHRQTYTNTTPVPCVCTICSPSCRIARKLLSIPTLDIALRWLADGLCVFTLPLEWTYWRIIWLQCHIVLKEEVHSVFSVNLPGALCGCTATTSPVVLLYRVYRVQILILQNLNSG